VPEIAATLLIEDGLAIALIPAFSMALARRARTCPPERNVSSWHERARTGLPVPGTSTSEGTDDDDEWFHRPGG
ncbi:hypothetical protein, partial [Streptomyces viridosporus]|uniref:hypothetical protein n=1 Tax=Streptomyces viridosporus TaxID=67581 RepID=UPI0033296399